MIPQIGFAEMMVLALLAIIVVGPKDLPKLMRTVGGFMARIRAMGQEFKDAFDDMGADAEMSELRKEIEDLKKMGKMSNLSDEAFAEDMRALDDEIREGTNMNSPKVSSTKTAAREPDVTGDTSSDTSDKSET